MPSRSTIDGRCGIVVEKERRKFPGRFRQSGRPRSKIYFVVYHFVLLGWCLLSTETFYFPIGIAGVPSVALQYSFLEKYHNYPAWFVESQIPLYECKQHSIQFNTRHQPFLAHIPSAQIRSSRQSPTSAEIMGQLLACTILWSPSSPN